MTWQFTTMAWPVTGIVSKTTRVDLASAKRTAQGLTLVHFAAQPEPLMTQNTP